MSEKDFLSMSDEDFLKAGGKEPEPVETPASGVDANAQENTQENNNEDNKDAQQPVTTEEEPDGGKSDDNNPDPNEPNPDDKSGKSEDEDGNKEPKQGEEEPKPAKDPKDGKKSEEQQPKPDKSKEDDSKGKKDEPKPEDKSVDYKAFFEQVMTPFKANGREIKLNSPEEVIRLMQMGAGYGRKLQDMQPHLKTLRMLEKNDLLDENKLSYLIDLQNKNPDAIKKLIKESGIDPLDINTEGNTEYRPTNHSVTDAEMSFQNTLQDVQTRPNGHETIRIANGWDKQSKEELWKSPEILSVIQEQRENGLFDQITAELDRQKLLGGIPSHTPFLVAYKMAGDILVQQSRLVAPGAKQQQPANPQPQAQVQPQPLGRSTQQPKPSVSHSEQAQAASPSKSKSSAAKIINNPLEMADEDFLKQFNGRI